jgi:hypothetical protein
MPDDKKLRATTGILRRAMVAIQLEEDVRANTIAKLRESRLGRI